MVIGQVVVEAGETMVEGVDEIQFCNSFCYKQENPGGRGFLSCNIILGR